MDMYFITAQMKTIISIIMHYILEIQYKRPDILKW